MHHEWGDGFDFDSLYEAGIWITKFYRRATGHTLMWKEKYGTIRYEFTSTWLNGEVDEYKFFEIVKRATKKFPHIAGEICDDVYITCTDGDWAEEYIEYFDAVLDRGDV